MSIMDIFRNFGSGDSGQQPPQQQQQPVPDASANNPTVPGNATVKPDGNGPTAFPNVADNVGEKSPLQGFEDLWKNAPTDAKTPGSFVPQMNADMTKLMNASQLMDFSKVLSPELVQKATSGDTAAFAEVLNGFGRAVWANSAAASSKIIETALQKQADTFQKEYLPEVLRRERINNTLSDDNPLYSNPAVAPMFDMVKERLAQKFPAASPQEIANKAREYMGGFAQEFAKTQNKTYTDITETKTAASETDWSKFFGV